MWRVVFGGLRPVSSLLERLCACTMTERTATPSAKRLCTEERDPGPGVEQSSEPTKALAGPRERKDDARESVEVPVKTQNTFHTSNMQNLL